MIVPMFNVKYTIHGIDHELEVSQNDLQVFIGILIHNGLEKLELKNRDEF